MLKPYSGCSPTPFSRSWCGVRNHASKQADQNASGKCFRKSGHGLCVWQSTSKIAWLWYRKLPNATKLVCWLLCT
jgi:hypothetical protein